MQWPCPHRFLPRISIQACGVMAPLACLLLAPEAWAQTGLPAAPGVFTPQPAPLPVRPLPYSPFGYYDLLAGFRPAYLGAPQSSGHEIVATSPNGYIYRPVYDPAPGAPASPPAGPRQALAPEIQSAIQDFQAGRYEAALTRLQQLTAADAGNAFVARMPLGVAMRAASSQSSALP